MVKPPIKFNPEDPAHVAAMRRTERRLVDPHGVGFSKGRRPGDGAVVEVLDEDVTAEDAGRIAPLGWKP